ncbi:MAG: hypothetical protein ABJM29_05700 [Rhizobiaceae bacterium]
MAHRSIKTLLALGVATAAFVPVSALAQAQLPSGGPGQPIIDPRLRAWEEAIHLTHNAAVKAVEHCDRGTFNGSMSTIEWLARQLALHAEESDESGSRNSREPSDAAFNESAIDINVARLLFVEAPTVQEDIKELSDDLKERWKENCDHSNSDSITDVVGPKAEVSVRVFTGFMELLNAPGFLGSEVAGDATTRELGVVDGEDSGDVSGFELEVKITPGAFPFGPPSFANPSEDPILKPRADPIRNPWHFSVTARQESVEFEKMLEDYDQQVGRVTLLPGVGVGPNASGFVIPDGYGDVTEINYDGDYDSKSFRVGAGFSWDFPDPDINVFLNGGAEVGSDDVETRFSGVTNSGTLPFSYDTEYENEWLAMSMFFKVEKNLGLSEDVLAKVSVNASYSRRFNDASGYDTLEVLGFEPGMADLSNNDSTDGYGLGAEIELDLTPFLELDNKSAGKAFFRIGGSYERVGNIGVVTRDGENPSMLEFEDADKVTGHAALVFKLP